MYDIMENIKRQQHCGATNVNYQGIWRNFNKFLIRLDSMPRHWEDRVAIYTTYLIKNGCQSATVKSYISAIKSVLLNDNYQWDDKRAQLTSLTRACRVINDKVKDRLPIQIGLLELILHETERKFSYQFYLELLYKCLFAMAYFGLFRVGELTSGTHPIKAKDVYNSVNNGKHKMKILLYTSKTHGKESKPQTIKIEGNIHLKTEKRWQNRHFDPYEILNNFLTIRGGYSGADEPLFIFSDGTPVMPKHMHRTLKEIITKCQLDPDMYDTHSFRIGRATDMLKFGYSIEKVKRCGRWKSNAVYKYLKYLD